MRNLLFALLMVAAAFVGGAVVNGPGMVWLQAAVRTLANKSDFVKVVDSNKAQTPEAEGHSAAVVAPEEPRKEIPAAPMPPLVVAAKAEAPGKESTSEADPRPAVPAKSDRPVDVASAAPAPPSPLPKSAVEIASPLPPPVSEAPPRDASVAAASSPAVEIPPPTPPRSEPVRDPVAGRALVVSQATPIGRAEPAAEPGASSVVASRIKNGDWSALRKQLVDAGVTRYEVEAEVTGRVRFRCVIPVAGRRAVAQMFEGEGNDEFQAAESALKRIRLWRVSEGVSTN